MDVHPTKNGIFIGIDPYPYMCCQHLFSLVNLVLHVYYLHIDFFSERSPFELQSIRESLGALFLTSDELLLENGDENCVKKLQSCPLVNIQTMVNHHF